MHYGDLIQFDPIETLPRKFKEFFARGATELVPPTPRSMLEAANPHWKPETVKTEPPHRPSDANQFLHPGHPVLHAPALDC